MTLFPLRRRLLLAIACLMLCSAGTARAGHVADRVNARHSVRVCIWPDYYGITWRNPRTGQLQGLDIDMSQEFASDLQASVQYVESSFVSLVDDLRQERCDVAMFAIAMLPQRTAQLHFSEPYLQSDVYAVTTRSNAVVHGWADIDRPGVRVAVQAGTFMEPVMAASLKRAQLVSIKPPATRERELESGRVDVFMTDYPYSRRLLDNADWATLVSPPAPFHVLPYGYATAPDDDAWTATVEAFVRRAKHDGRLDAAARRHGLTAIVVH
jgi:ABC-type amino acid transport substrate-binding protein